MAEPRKNIVFEEVLPTAEPCCWALAVIGYLLKWALVPDGTPLLVMGLAGAALCSFLTTFAPNPLQPEEEYGPPLTPTAPVKPSNFFTRSVAPKIARLGGAVTLLGILFKLLYLPGYETQLLVGLFSMLVAIAAMAVGRYRLGLRTLLTACLGLLAFFTPSETLIRQFHRNDPALAEQLIYQLQHPRDTVATAAVHAHSSTN